MRKRWTGFTIGVIAVVMTAGCGERGMSSGALPQPSLPQAHSQSPSSISVPPMPSSPRLPSSLMTSRRVPDSVIESVQWTRLSGVASVVAASPDGSIWVLGPAAEGANRSIWHYANGAWTNIPGTAAHLAVSPNGTLWSVTAAGGIYALSGTSWSTIGGGASDISIGADNSVYIISNQPGNSAGRGIWRYVNGTWSQLPGSAVHVDASWDTGTFPHNVVPGGVWLANAQGAVSYYSPGGGTSAFSGNAAALAPTGNGGLFALGNAGLSGGHDVYYCDLISGAWSGYAGSAISISATTNYVYIVSSSGAIYVASVIPSAATTGTVTNFSVGISPNAAPHDIVAGPDGNLWFTENTEDRIGRITPSGIVTEFSSHISTDTTVNSIAAGPDGNVWFTEYGATTNRVAKITPAGVVTEYSAGITSNSQLDGITAGPDGNLWFCEQNSNRIGKITTSGTVTEYSSGITPFAGPFRIAQGPDGNLWFTEVNVNKIGKITTSGVVTEYPSPTKPYAITAGPTVIFGSPATV